MVTTELTYIYRLVRRIRIYWRRAPLRSALEIHRRHILVRCRGSISALPFAIITSTIIIIISPANSCWTVQKERRFDGFNTPEENMRGKHLIFFALLKSFPGLTGKSVCVCLMWPACMYACLAMAFCSGWWWIAAERARKKVKGTSGGGTALMQRNSHYQYLMGTSVNPVHIHVCLFIY